LCLFDEDPRLRLSVSGPNPNTIFGFLDTDDMELCDAIDWVRAGACLYLIADFTVDGNVSFVSVDAFPPRSEIAS